ncbi:MAG: ribonuclease H-like domain-containing protein [Actinomycetota bacterium]
MEKRDDRITEESIALVEYERYLETGNDRILRDLEEYNRYDCISLYYLQRWLERRRVELKSIVGHELSRPTVEEAEASETLTAALQEVQACAAALTRGGVPENERSPEQHGRWLLSELLSWHRREAKSEWWRYFDRHKKTPEELIDDSECLSGLGYEGVVGQVARSEIYKLTFPTQEHKIEPGSRYEDLNTGKGITVTEVNNDELYVLIKVFPVPGGPCMGRHELFSVRPTRTADARAFSPGLLMLDPATVPLMSGDRLRSRSRAALLGPSPSIPAATTCFAQRSSACRCTFVS